MEFEGMGLDFRRLSCLPDSTSNWLDTARNLGDASLMDQAPCLYTKV